MSNEPLVPVFSTLPLVRRLGPDAPWSWLQAGWADLVRCRRISLAYGAIWTTASWLLTAVLFGTETLALLLPLAGGFLLIAPLLAVGLYDVSRRIAAGEVYSLATSLLAWRARPWNIAGMGLVLLLIQLAWVRLALLLYALFFSGSGLGLEDMWPAHLQTAAGLVFLALGTAIGAVLALLVFTLAAVSLPMLIDRDVDLFTAMATSVSAVRTNPRAMLQWAAVIVFLMLVGIASLFLGLAVTLPLVGHATWHAYRDLVV